jgi:putative aldouronate transport system permease protein
MHIRKSFGEHVFDVIIYAVLVTFTFLCLYPMLYVLFASLSEPSRFIRTSGLIFRPQGVSLSAFAAVLRNPNIRIGYGNTLVYLAAGTSINLVFTTMGAYVVSRPGFMFRRVMSLMIVFTMFFGGGLIPTYLLVNNTLGWGDTRWALIVPNAISAWNMILMKSFFESLPVSLEESAKIDGANDIIILIRIVLPVSTAVIAVMALFYGVGHWNAWFDAMVYLRKRDLYPLQLILREILVTNDTANMAATSNIGDQEQVGITIRYATVMVATIPILCFYPFIQKYFVKGVMIGAIKG